MQLEQQCQHMSTAARHPAGLTGPASFAPVPQALFSSLGYTFLDVRSDLECEDQGRVRGSVHIPKVYAARVWSPEEQRKVCTHVYAVGVLGRSPCLPVLIALHALQLVAYVAYIHPVDHSCAVVCSLAVWD